MATDTELRIGPQIPLRALREAHGLTASDLAARITELGVPVVAGSIRNIEAGSKSASPKLMYAWATALGVKPVDIRQGRDLRDYLLIA